MPTTWALSARDQGQVGRCRDILLVSRPGLAGLVSRQTPWCRDMVGFHGVATHCWFHDKEAAGGPNWCHDTPFGVLTWARQFGVATYSWCCDMAGVGTKLVLG